MCTCVHVLCVQYYCTQYMLYMHMHTAINVTQFGKTAHLLTLSYKPMFAKNIFFGEESFFTPSYNMITHGSFDTKIARYIVVFSAL